MIIAGIVIETWKLPIFERWLTRHGYKYVIADQDKFSPDVLVLKVETSSARALKDVVELAQNEAARTEKPK